MSIVGRASIDIPNLIFYNSFIMERKNLTSSAAKTLSDLGAIKGGYARSAALTSEKRKEIARNAVKARWARVKGVPISKIGKPEQVSPAGRKKEQVTGLVIQKQTTPIKATHTGVLKIGKNIEIPCYVLENGERVVSGRGLQNAFGYSSNASGQALVKEISKFKDRTVIEAVEKRISFKRPGAGGAAEITYGYKGELLVDICDLLLDLRKRHKLTPQQENLANYAEILIRAFAKVGVIALIDEATGYDKEKDEYQKILQLFIAPEIQPHIKTFDENFYKQLYRLQGWKWENYKDKKKRNHPQYVGKLTNRLIYEKLAPGVLEELRKRNPKNEKGNRKSKHFQYLTVDVGYIELVKLLSAVTVLLEQFPDNHLPDAIQKIDAKFKSFTPIYQTGMDFPIYGDKEKFDTVIEDASKPLLTEGKKVE